MSVSPAPAGKDRLWVSALRRIRRRRSVILGYHGIADAGVLDDLSLLLVPPARFRRQLELMLAAGFRFVTLAQLVEEGGTEPPPGFAVVTFDDGMRNNHSVALPILRELGIPATVFVTVDFIGGSSPWVGAGGDGAMLSEDELRALVREGWELGAHTLTHADLSELDYEHCRREIDQSRAALERTFGVAVRTLAYPFGRYGPAALAAARDSGLLAAVTTGSGSWEHYELTRAMIGAADPLPIVLLKLTDRYEPLLQTAPLRLLRNASRRLRARIGALRSGAAS
jgi:peptidoglycan/xylan/chitin deacetylase (PgdA/CDA1 family)